jgi:hypothetical protein
MNTPTGLKPTVHGAIVGAMYGAIVGVMVVAVGGFVLGDWVTAGTKNDRALAMGHNQAVFSIVPVCIDLARRDPMQAADLETIRAMPSFRRRRDVEIAVGSATMLGGDILDREITQGCLAEFAL